MNKFRRLGERFKSAMQGGTADDQLNKFVLPSNVTSELANITPEEGMMAYDTTLQKVVYNDGSGFGPVSAGITLPLTTKGDLFGYSTLNARVPVGTNGQVLTADSAQALGLKWATPATSANTALSNLTSPTAVNQDLIFSGTDPSVSAPNGNLHLSASTQIRTHAVVVPASDGSQSLGTIGDNFNNVKAYNHQIAATDSTYLSMSANAAANYSIVWPGAQGAASTFLQNDGSGVLSWSAASGGATTALDNLASVAINTALLPASDNSINSGSIAKRWQNIFVRGVIGSAGDGVIFPAIDVNGTTLYRSTGAAALSWGNMRLLDGGSQTSVDWNLHTLNDTTGTAALSYGSGQTVLANGITFSNANWAGSSTVTGGTATKNVTSLACSPTSKVFVTLTTNDATAILKNVVPGSGSFDVNLTANATGDTTFCWVIFA